MSAWRSRGALAAPDRQQLGGSGRRAVLRAALSGPRAAMQRRSRSSAARPSGAFQPGRPGSKAPVGAGEPPLADGRGRQPKDPKARKILVIGDFVAGGLAWGLDQTLRRGAEARRHRQVERRLRPGARRLFRLEQAAARHPQRGEARHRRRRARRQRSPADARRQGSGSPIALGRAGRRPTPSASTASSIRSRSTAGRSSGSARRRCATTARAARHGLSQRPLQAARSTAAGGHFVDIWNGFTDARTATTSPPARTSTASSARCAPATASTSPAPGG